MYTPAKKYITTSVGVSMHKAHKLDEFEERGYTSERAVA